MPLRVSSCCISNVSQGLPVKLFVTPGQPAGARSPIEDSSLSKGRGLVCGVEPTAEASINDFAIACLRKISMMGAVSQKVGFACVQALGEMGSNEAISQLARLRTKVKYTVALRLIEKCLREAAERSGLTVDQLEDVAAPSYAIDAEGKAEIAVGDCDATIHLCGDGEVGVMWRNAEGRPVKTASSYIKAAFPKEAGVLRS